MARIDYLFTVVKHGFPPKPWPPLARVVDIGVPLSVAQRYAGVRRGMSPKGLARKSNETRN